MCTYTHSRHHIRHIRTDAQVSGVDVHRDATRWRRDVLASTWNWLNKSMVACGGWCSRCTLSAFRSGFVSSSTERIFNCIFKSQCHFVIKSFVSRVCTCRVEMPCVWARRRQWHARARAPVSLWCALFAPVQFAILCDAMSMECVYVVFCACNLIAWMRCVCDCR